MLPWTIPDLFWCHARAIAALAGLLAAATWAVPMHAATRGQRDGSGTITATSHYGNPPATARVRHGRFGLDVDLGNNSWMPCEAGDCRETLRRHKIDYWETIREDGAARD